MTELPAPRVCLCVPTFRRPDGLRKLLAHVEQLNYAGPIDVIVVDNDAEGRAGAAVVEADRADVPLAADLHRRAAPRPHLRL